MQYRKIEKLGISPSALGFGCMRFPQNPDGSINEPEAQKMLEHAVAAGVTYIDTAYPYHNGESEPFVGRAIKRFDRESFFLATKLPMWLVQTKEDAKRLFEEQLKRLDVDYVDFYLLHTLNQSYWDVIKREDLIAFGEELKAQGKIRYFGFSFHDEYPLFEEIVQAHKWDFCQIQYNYVDTEYQAGEKGYQLATKLGIPVIAMEPVKGGSLATFPDKLADQMKSHHKDKSLASWALRWVGSRENVKVILSGMSTMEQLEDNLATFDPFVPLDEIENKIVQNTAATIAAHTNNGCTNCQYCMPCPFDVNIPMNFLIWNEYGMYDNADAIKWKYSNLIQESSRADNCTGCGACVEKCPQHIPIPDDLKKVHQTLSKLYKA